MIYPFKSIKSNRAEILSLLFLSTIATANFLKATLIKEGYEADGEIANLLKHIVPLENIFLLTLLSFILIQEVVFNIHN